MCLCGGVSTGTHRDKKRVLDDPGPGGCDLADVCAGKVSKCSNHRAISPVPHMKLTTKLETPWNWKEFCYNKPTKKKHLCTLILKFPEKKKIKFLSLWIYLIKINSCTGQLRYILQTQIYLP